MFALLLLLAQPPAPMLPFPPIDRIYVPGVIQSVNGKGDIVVIKLGSGERRMLQFTPKTEVTFDGLRGEFGQLAAGQYCHAFTTTDGRLRRLISIDVYIGQPAPVAPVRADTVPPRLP
jgi:hypothetical protein